MSKRRKKGQLSPEDKELWSKVARTATPLEPDRLKSLEKLQPFPDLETAEKTAKQGTEKTATAIQPPSKPNRTAPPPLRQLEHRYRRKIVRGVRSIDARIDLHGLNQHQAHDRLRSFLYGAQAQGHKIVLVITGKGGGSGYAEPGERGILRRIVPQWLAMPDMRPVVLGYEEAHITHGGSGALYVRIRRRR